MKSENDNNSPLGVVRRAGASAYWDDLTLLDNPYAPDRRAHAAWADGWTMAKAEAELKATKRTDAAPAEQED